MTLAVIAVVGFAVFLVWELTDEHPIVDLSLFRGRNFSVSTVAMLVGYGLYFGNVVLLPLWLQQYMGYTATLAGLVLAPVGRAGDPAHAASSAAISPASIRAGSSPSRSWSSGW